MTAARERTRELFRQAVATVRAAPIPEPTLAPAFALPEAAGRAPRVGRGDVDGLPGDIWSTARAIEDGSVAPADVLAAAADATDRFDDLFHVFEARAEAAPPGTAGPLAGIPITVKDVIDAAGLPTRGSSEAVAPRLATQEAAAVSRLRAAGAVITGKVSTHEFALGVTTPQSRNPWAPDRIPGGSSGGSAISIVTGMALGSLGTDTRASIRVPAALCGLVGFKASFGVVPVDHWLTLSWTMDHLAPMARSVRDVALLMDVLAASGTRFRNCLPGDLAGARFGWSPALVAGSSPGVAAVFRGAVSLLEAAGGRIVELAEPSDEDIDIANGAGMVVSRAEAARFHAEYGTRVEAGTDEVRAQLEEAAELLATDYLRAFQLRGLLRARLEALFAEVDCLVMPTAKVVAPPRESAGEYLLVLSQNCIPWSFVDFPAITLFAGLDGGLPVGLQLVGPPAGDELLLSLAHAAERVLPPPPRWSMP